MALKWNTFSGRDRKPQQKKEEKITQQDIKNMVSQEVSAASMKNQLMKYMDDVQSQGIRTEALINEMKESIDASLGKLEELAEFNSVDKDKLEEIQKSVNKAAGISNGLEASIHKDNLISYKNIRDIITESDGKNSIRAGKIRSAVFICLFLNVITLIGVAISILIGLGIL